MYCVKCGVKLQEGVESCPLCHTPVWNPDKKTESSGYSDVLPERKKKSTLPLAAALSIIGVVAIGVIIAICFKLYGALEWGGYVICGIELLYIIGALPLWFEKPKGEVFVAIDYVALALCAFYVCLKTEGHWFWNFAFPVILGALVLTVSMICLLKYVKGRRLFVFGGFLILLGGFTVLVEFFEHLTFGTEMFLWSLYSLVGFGAAGLFLLLAGMIPPLKAALQRKFFF